MQYEKEIEIEEDMLNLNIFRIEGCQCSEVTVNASTAIVELCIKSI